MFDNDWSMTASKAVQLNIFMLSIGPKNITTNKHIFIEVYVYILENAKYNENAGIMKWIRYNGSKKKTGEGNANALGIKGTFGCLQWWWSQWSDKLEKQWHGVRDSRQTTQIQIQVPQPNKQDHKPKTTTHNMDLSGKRGNRDFFTYAVAIQLFPSNAIFMCACVCVWILKLLV